MGRGQRFLQIIRLNTLVDVIRVANACTSCEYLLIDTKFVSILLLFSVLFLLKKAKISGKLITSGISDIETDSIHSEKKPSEEVDYDNYIIIIITSNRKTIY